MARKHKQNLRGEWIPARPRGSIPAPGGRCLREEGEGNSGPGASKALGNERVREPGSQPEVSSHLCPELLPPSTPAARGESLCSLFIT